MSSSQNATYLTPSDPPKGSNRGPVKPTLLAFHGSGSNATVHTVQLARLTRFLKPHFEIESLQAPFPSPAGPGILPFFDGCGPFYRWLPPSEKVSIESMRSGSSTALLAPEVEDLVKSTVLRIRAAGGNVVGLIGFSQGTKVVAGLLRASEIRKQGGREEDGWCDFAFGLSVCASYPPGLVPSGIAAMVADPWGEKIRLPAFHVQGRQDEWMWAGQGMIDRHYEEGEGRSEVVVWDMGHHYPVEAEQSERMAEWMVAAAKSAEGGKDVR